MDSTFRLGEWLVEPQQRLISSGDRHLRLEPKSMAVLCALAAAGGRPLSRDALIEAAWRGRVISDDAVNRQVAKLRQALGDDPRAPRYIETIPKTGFRLLPSAEACESAPGPRRASRWRRWPPAIAAALGVALLGFGLYRSGGGEGELRLTQITSAPGLEIHPSPSPSGRALVYAARTPPRSDFDLYVHDVAAASAARLTRASSHELHPAWSPDGELIAYLEVADGACEIRVRALYDDVARSLGDCREAHRAGGLSWSPDAEFLYYADRAAADAPFALRRLRLADGSVENVLQPRPGTIGDTTPRVAGDGTVAFLRVRTLGVEDLYLLTEPGAVRRATFDGGKIHGLAWHDDRVVIASNRHGGLFGLWQVEPYGLGVERLAAPPGADGPGSNGRAVVFEQWSSQVDLWSAPLAGGAEPQPLASSTRWDWWPAVGPDGRQLAWTSDRSGAAEVWLDDGTRVRRLTDFGGPYTQAPVWSPDGRFLAVTAPVDGQFDVFLVSTESGATRRITRTPEDEAAPLFAADGRLLFRRDLQPNRSVLVDEAGVVIAEDVRSARYGPDGALWFTRPGQRGLWRERGGTAEQVTAELETVDWLNWWVDTAGVHLVIRPEPDRPLLARLDPDTGVPEVLRELPDLLYKSGLTRLGDAVVYAREVRTEADVYGLAPAT